MKALMFDGSLHYVNAPIPSCSYNDVLIKVTYAGICNTDIEITKGYMQGFKGIPGHEYIGIVTDANDKNLIGKRVTSEINCSCGSCSWCEKSLGRHCPNRTVLGIDRRNGAFAQFVSVPQNTLIIIPESIPDMTAIFIEPLAAALEILEQITITKAHTVLLIGDGKLAQLIAIVLHYNGCQLKVLGKHQEKISLLSKNGIDIVTPDLLRPQSFDIVIEASGSPAAFSSGLSLVKPRGIFVLKSTYAQTFDFNPASIVINELTLIGSRCGRLASAIDFLLNNPLDLSYLISDIVPFSKCIEAFKMAQQKGAMKIILSMNES